MPDKNRAKPHIHHPQFFTNLAVYNNSPHVVCRLVRTDQRSMSEPLIVFQREPVIGDHVALGKMFMAKDEIYEVVDVQILHDAIAGLDEGQARLVFIQRV